MHIYSENKSNSGTSKPADDVTTNVTNAAVGAGATALLGAGPVGVAVVGVAAAGVFIYSLFK